MRDRWVTVRAAGASSVVGADARIAGLHQMLAEQRRDDLLETAGLFDLLFLHAEGYLRSATGAGRPTFKELLRARDLERARLVPILPPVDEARR